MQKNKTIEFMRVGALFLVLIYHIWVYLGSGKIWGETIISLGGEIGVTLFFIISGFSIYASLERKNTNFVYKDYIVNRIKRIAPQYYASLIVALLFTGAGAYISKAGLFEIITHIFGIHNLFIRSHGAISGVLWTMGVIFQFYLIAPIIYKFIVKYNKMVLLIALILEVLSRYITFWVIDRIPEINSMAYFIYGRQLITVIAEFVIGMFLAKKLLSIDTEKNDYNKVFACCMIAIMLLAAYAWGKIALIYGLCISSITGYCWYIVLAFILVVFIFNLNKFNIQFKSKLGKTIEFLAKCEYGIYVWHLLVMESLIQHSDIFKYLVQMGNKVYVYVLFLVTFIAVGVIFTNVIEKHSLCKK